MFPAYLCIFIILLNLKRNSSKVSVLPSGGVWPGGLGALIHSLLGTESRPAVGDPAWPQPQRLPLQHRGPACGACSCSQAFCWCRGKDQPRFESVIIAIAVSNDAASHLSVLKINTE